MMIALMLLAGLGATYVALILALMVLSRYVFDDNLPNGGM